MLSLVVVTDILNDDFDYKNFLKVKSKAPNGVVSKIHSSASTLFLIELLDLDHDH